MKRKPDSKRKKGSETDERREDDRPFRKEMRGGERSGCDAYSGSNDWRWYAKNEQILRDVASFPYGLPVGGQYDLGSLADNYDVNAVPGIMAIYTAPAFGYSDNPNSPVNIAARNLFTFVRHANSGSWNYNAPDMMLYILAMDSLYSYVSYLKRIYGVASLYSVTNRYYPKAMVQAMGVDFEDLQSNLADFRAAINILAVKANKFVVPSTMAYTARHEWMYDHIYIDAETDKPQTYLYVPDGFFKYGLTKITDAGGEIFTSGELSYTRLMPLFGNLTGQPAELQVGTMNPVPLLTVADLINYGNNLVDPLLQSQDINVMCGDILKAFGDRVHRISGIAEDYTVLPMYNMEVLDQIQNATLIGSYVDGTSITQDETKGWLVFKPWFDYPYSFTDTTYRSPGFNAYWSKRLINFQKSGVEPKDTMVATRLTNIASAQDNDNLRLQFSSIASDVACYAHIYYYGQGDMDAAELEGSVWQLWRSRTLYLSNTAVIELNKRANYTIPISPTIEGVNSIVLSSMPDYDASSFDQLADVFRLTHMLTNFDRHPFIAVNAGFVIDTYSGQKSANFSSSLKLITVQTGRVTVPVYSQYTGYLGDIANFTIVDRENLRAMAEAALLSMFDPE